MDLTVYSSADFAHLSAAARSGARLRQHRNLHSDYADPCQRLFNAIEPGSYIRPHRHASVPRDEMLVAMRGLMALITFADDGSVDAVLPFASEKYGDQLAAGIEVPCHRWHTVVALTTGAVLLEVKAGPFDPAQPKNLAPWAPEEGSEAAAAYLASLRQRARAAAEGA